MELHKKTVSDCPGSYIQVIEMARKRHENAKRQSAQRCPNIDTIGKNTTRASKDNMVETVLPELEDTRLPLGETQDPAEEHCRSLMSHWG